MNSPSIQMSPSIKVAELTPSGMKAVKQKANPASTRVLKLMLKSPMLQKSQGLAKNLKPLLALKHKLHRHRCGRGRGPKRGRRARRQRMHQRMGRPMDQLMGRLQRLMMSHQKNGCAQAQDSNNGNDMSFMNDPKLSMNDKVELFLEKIIKDSESKIEELMKQYESQGQGQSQSEGQGKSGFGSKLLSIFSKVAPIAAGIFGGPVAGVAAQAIGSAVSGGAASSTEASKSSGESDQRMTMLKIQKLQDHVKQMFDFFSNTSKKQNDLLANITRNMA